tara:strand:- start:2665 stop:2832 length:168 start_codon:yes stop_codon:yes gene_type:complete
MSFIDEKIEEMGRFVGVVSFGKGTDNYNRLRKIILESYNAGLDGEPIEEVSNVED